MKKLIIIVLAILAILIIFLLNQCSVIHSLAPVAGSAPSLVKLVILAVLALYEVLARIIPTIGNYSIIGIIIDLLKKLSDLLNNRTGNKPPAPLKL